MATLKSKKSSAKKSAGSAVAESASDTKNHESPLFIRSSEKVFRVFEAFGPEHHSLSVARIAKLTGLDMSSAQRCTHTLFTLGFLTRGSDGKSYKLSPRTLSIGQRYIASNFLIQTSLPLLIELNRKFEETTSLCVLVGSDVIFINRLPGRQFLNVQASVGSSMPAFCTAPGLAMLSRLPESQVESVLAGSELRIYAPNTQTDPAKIRERLETARNIGYVISEEEFLAGDISVAAPILGETGEAVGAVNIAVPTMRWTKAEAADKIAPIILQAARMISQRLGFNP